jgi:hypothetical protein
MEAFPRFRYSNPSWDTIHVFSVCISIFLGAKTFFENYSNRIMKTAVSSRKTQETHATSEYLKHKERPKGSKLNLRVKVLSQRYLAKFKWS